MLVITRKHGQKIMINDNIVITIVDSRNGQCKIAIEADKDVKIYREEIYYQIKLANLIGTNTNVNAVDTVSNMINSSNLKLNNEIVPSTESVDIVAEKSSKSGKFIIKKKKTTTDNN